MQTYIQTYRQDELTIHSIMSVHECARRANKLAKLASKLDSNIGQHHWPAPLASTINTTCQQHSAAPMVSTTDRHHWPGPLAACSKHFDDDENAAEAQIHVQIMLRTIHKNAQVNADAQIKMCGCVCVRGCGWLLSVCACVCVCVLCVCLQMLRSARMP